MVELVDEADMNPAQSRPLRVIRRPGIAPTDAHPAGIRRIEQPGRLQQGRFSGAGRSDQRDRLARQTRSSPPGARGAPALRNYTASIGYSCGCSFDPLGGWLFLKSAYMPDQGGMDNNLSAVHTWKASGALDRADGAEGAAQG